MSPLLALIAVALLLALIFGPQLWARHVFRRYSRELPQLRGNGGELARHLVDTLGLQSVGVEEAPAEGDHYDPRDRTVRLSPENLSGRSLTAITVAAHEVGHAIQHARNERSFHWSMRIRTLALQLQRLSVLAILLAPLLALITRHPVGGLLPVGIALGGMLAAVLAQLVTLPVEWDASFGKALPILVNGGYIAADDEPAARRILTAAALTYVAAALASLLNMWRWLRLLRH